MEDSKENKCVEIESTSIRSTKPHIVLQVTTTRSGQNNYLPLQGQVRDKKRCKEFKTKRGNKRQHP